MKERREGRIEGTVEGRRKGRNLYKLAQMAEFLKCFTLQMTTMLLNIGL